MTFVVVGCISYWMNSFSRDDRLSLLVDVFLFLLWAFWFLLLFINIKVEILIFTSCLIHRPRGLFGIIQFSYRFWTLLFLRFKDDIFYGIYDIRKSRLEFKVPAFDCFEWLFWGFGSPITIGAISTNASFDLCFICFHWKLFFVCLLWHIISMYTKWG